MEPFYDLDISWQRPSLLNQIYLSSDLECSSSLRGFLETIFEKNPKYKETHLSKFWDTQEGIDKLDIIFGSQKWRSLLAPKIIRSEVKDLTGLEGARKREFLVPSKDVIRQRQRSLRDIQHFKEPDKGKQKTIHLQIN